MSFKADMTSSQGFCTFFSLLLALAGAASPCGVPADSLGTVVCFSSELQASSVLLRVVSLQGNTQTRPALRRKTEQQMRAVT